MTVEAAKTVLPRRRESRGGLPRLRHYKAIPFGIPAYAGMTVGAAGMTVAAANTVLIRYNIL